MGYKHYSSCRICGSKNLYKFLDLGEQPLANAYLTNPYQTEPLYPLRVYFCKDCGLIQLCDVVNPKELFTKYSYFTGYSSQTMQDHFHQLAQSIEKDFKLTKNDIVVDIGGNDGTLLDGYTLPVTINVEPSLEQSIVSEKKGHATYTDFFDTECARGIVEKHGKAKIITACNVFAHVDNLYEFMAAVKLLLKPDGIFIIEVHHAYNFIKNLEWDVTYHEHLSYFTLGPLNCLASFFNLNIFRVEEIPTQGGSLRLYLGNTANVGTGYHYVEHKEHIAGLYESKTYEDYQQKVDENVRQLWDLLYTLDVIGEKVFGYGTPAKSSTLIYYAEIEPYIKYMIDTTPAKQGKYTPGSHIPIYTPEKGKVCYGYAIMFPYNYKEEILAKEKEFLKKGGKFIIPIPEVTVVGVEDVEKKCQKTDSEVGKFNV